MKEYHKIQTVYLRDPENKYKSLLEGQYARPEFEALKNITWIFTEKVDGTNIRVKWDGDTVTFAGKTDRADTPKFLLERLEEMFIGDMFVRCNMPPMCLYGEGYGAKIQKGGESYIPDGVSFILFDVKVDRFWLERNNVENIADKLAVKVVPIVGKGSLLDGIEMARNGYESRLRQSHPEGLVMRPEIELFTQCGKRVITKIKLKDF